MSGLQAVIGNEEIVPAGAQKGRGTNVPGFMPLPSHHRPPTAGPTQLLLDPRELGRREGTDRRLPVIDQVIVADDVADRVQGPLHVEGHVGVIRQQGHRHDRQRLLQGNGPGFHDGPPPLEHSRILQALPDAIRDQINSKAPGL
jgi:hypothetical protein